MSSLNTQVECLKDQKCQWDAKSTQCNTHSCLLTKDESICKANSACQYDATTTTCSVEKCQLFTSGTECNADATCSWNGYNCGLDKTIKCPGRRILDATPPRRALSQVSTLKKIIFGQVECVIDEATLTSEKIECTLVDEPVCGSWDPEVFSALGLIPVKAGTAKTQVDCTITSVAPSVDLNVLGFDNLTITGTNFPRYLHDNTFDIEFSNTQKTKCITQTSDSTKLVCLTQRFDKVANLNEELTLKVTINGVEVTNSLTLKMKADNKKGIQMSPTSISPVLKGEIIFTLESNFPYALKEEDFSINATLKQLSTQVSPYYRQNQNTKVRKLSITAVDNTAKTVTVVFGGAYSGTYSIRIRHSQFGLIDTDDITLTVGSEVTSFSPATGSIYGGTLLTIHGNNWDPKVKENNPV